MAFRRRERGGEQLGILVVGRDEDVDGRRSAALLAEPRGRDASGMATTKRLKESMSTLYISAR